LEYVGSDDCVDDQDGEDEETFNEPVERVFERDAALLVDETLFVRSSPLVPHCRAVQRPAIFSVACVYIDTIGYATDDCR